MSILPEFLDSYLTISVANQQTGEIEEVDLGSVIDQIVLASKHPVRVLQEFLKVKQSITTLAYDFEKRYQNKEDEFRQWKANKNKELNYKDDRNPLIRDDSKTTNAAIKARLRSYPEYREYKDEIAELKTMKNILWSSKKTVETAITIVQVIMNDPKAIEDLYEVGEDQQMDELIDNLLEDEEFETDENGFHLRTGKSTN